MTFDDVAKLWCHGEGYHMVNAQLLPLVRTTFHGGRLAPAHGGEALRVHLAQHLLREEHHRETLAAALRLPEHAAATVPQRACSEHRGDGVVHAEELVILTDDLDQPGLVLGEQREVLHQIEQA